MVQRAWEHRESLTNVTSSITKQFMLSVRVSVPEASDTAGPHICNSEAERLVLIFQLIIKQFGENIRKKSTCLILDRQADRIVCRRPRTHMGLLGWHLHILFQENDAEIRQGAGPGQGWSYDGHTPPLYPQVEQ